MFYAKIIDEYGIIKDILDKKREKRGFMEFSEKMNNKSKSLDEISLIVHLYQKEKKSIRQISRENEISEWKIKKILKETVGIRKRGFSKEQKQEMYELYQKGTPKSKIAQQFSTDRSNVSRILLTNFGVQPKSIRHLSKNQILAKRIAQEYSNGASTLQLAQKYNTTAKTISTLLYRNEQSLRELGQAAKRTYSLDSDYFNEMTQKKATQLGMIWAIGHLDEKVSPHLVMSTTPSKLSILQTMLSGWIDLTERKIQINNTNSCRIRIYSLAHYRLFKTWGLRRAFPLEVLPYEDAFYEGFFQMNLVAHKNGICIRLNKSEPLFVNTLKAYLIKQGIPSETLTFHKGALFLKRKESVRQFIKCFPYTRQFLQYPSDYWETIYENL